VTSDRSMRVVWPRVCGFVIANLAGFFAGEVAAIEVGMGTRRARRDGWAAAHFGTVVLIGASKRDLGGALGQGVAVVLGAKDVGAVGDCMVGGVHI